MSISITKQDVIDEAGVDPWELESEFASDTDLEMIDSLAGIFRNGAEEADDAGGVAAYASSLEERAGTRGSNAIYADASEHLTQTYEDLGAENLENISSVLNTVAGEAESVLESNDDAINGPMGLDWLVDRHQSGATSDYDMFETWLSEQDGGEHDLFSYTVYEETFTYTKPTFRKDLVEAHIRDYRLTQAADGVSFSHDLMFERIDDYYAMLHSKEGQLAEYGYDVSDSPVPFWHTDGRAEHEAEQLERLLEEDDPDPEELERYTAGVERLAGSDDLTSQERSYLRSFYDTLEADDLAALGNLEGERYDGARGSVADGINTLMDPERGGIDPAEEDHLVPDSVKPLINENFLNQDLDEDQVNERIGQYNGLGELMSHASVPPGDRFGADMGAAALGIQTDYELWQRDARADSISGSPNYVRDADLYDDLTGTGQVLTMVATNPDAAALTLDSVERVDTLARLNWSQDNGEAAADFMRAATIPADGEEASRYQLDAAKNVLEVVSGDTAVARGDGPTTQHVEDAVLDTGLAYLDFLAREGTDDDGMVRNVLGQEVPGFALDGDARNGFFDFVATREQEQKDEFYGGVNAHAQQRMTQAFNEGGGTVEGSLENLARLHGGLDYAEYTVAGTNPEDASQRVEQNWRNGFQMASAINDTIGMIPPAGAVTGITGPIISGLESATVGEPPTADELRRTASYEDAVAEEGEARYWIAQGAANADNPPISQEQVDALRDGRGDVDFLPNLGDLERDGGYHDHVEDYRSLRRDIAAP
ncbi:putative alpha/beta hydrolase [Streptomyces johnsoniae]|uniref:Predicted hydrolase N-terminal domain-containing protein n=1 Tax=Streptomyces johnsoniae TaxID=3075532 RepID=A0ABU2SBE8_9ACTN|nr:hypothetical protein [Streptomyces sp. DSM 41886]MDT0445169.1 hypothetical protein [Streptomyces sp. DSM 41886]